MSQAVTAADPIAVIGMGCRFPGGVDSPDRLWQLLVDGVDAVREAPPERAGMGPAVGGYLTDISSFDADFFGISGGEADVLDPQHRLLLEVTWEALEHAGLAPERLAGTQTGVFTGLSYDDYMTRLVGAANQEASSVLSNGHCVAPGRISYLLGLRGPSIALDTACSSSLVALHLACQALRSRECDLALAGGVTLMISAETSEAFTRMRMLSPTGRCHTFDRSADGFARGEGCGIVVLKQLAAAERDGDRVLAVVRGSAINQDGASDGLAAPSQPAQHELYRRALTQADVRPDQVGLIETHGTGTPVGDPVEFASLTEVYGARRHRCALGSVKTNLGHLEPAAGVSGLIKAIQCLRHGEIPRNLHFDEWNPALATGDTPFFVPTQVTPWPVPESPRMAAVSSFGFSGTNAHVVLEQAPDLAADEAVENGPAVCLLPAASEAVLPRAASRLADWLAEELDHVSLQDVAHTLALRRSPGRGRLGVVAASVPELITSLRAFASGQADPAVVSGSVGIGVEERGVWVFSGQGSQWAGMGRRLLQEEPAFAAALTECDDLIRAETGFSVLDGIRAGEPIVGPGRVQPTLFAMQIALAAAWQAHGVHPAGVIGHSMGEVAAAVVAGALSLADGVRVICRRSELLARIAGLGAMATLGLDRSAAELEIARAGAAEDVSVAVLSAPGSVVVSGAPEAVHAIVNAVDARGVPAHMIAVDVASHSPQVDPLLSELYDALKQLRPQRPAIPFYSTVLTDPAEVPEFDAEYWCANLRRPVRLTDAVQAAATDRHAVYTEISPHPVVSHAVRATLDDLIEGAVVLATLRRDDDELAGFRLQLAAAHCAGVPVDWSVLCGHGSLVDLPPITFDRRRHWADASPAPVQRLGGGLPGDYSEVPGEPLRRTWRADVGTDAMPWLADHQVNSQPVLAGAAFVAIAHAACCQAWETADQDVMVRDLRLHEMLPLDGHTQLTTTVTGGDGDASCAIFSRAADGGWRRHASMTVCHQPSEDEQFEDIADLVARHTPMRNQEALYGALANRGLGYGPAFTGLVEGGLSPDRTSAWARLEIPQAGRSATDLRVDPVLLDCCLQMFAILVPGPADSMVLPVGIAEFRVLAEPASAQYCLARVLDYDDETVLGDIDVFDDAGRVVVRLRGLRLRTQTRETPAAADQWFLEPQWRRTQPLPAPPAGQGRWVLLGTTERAAGAVGDGLRRAGRRVDVITDPDQPRRLEEWREHLERKLAADADAVAGVVLLADSEAVQPQPAIDDTVRLVALAQALNSVCPAPPRLYVITTCRPSGVADEPVPESPTGFRGLVRVLALEHPALRATYLEVDSVESPALTAELVADAADDEVSLRGGQRYAARLTYRPISTAERTRATTRRVVHGENAYRLEAGQFGDPDQLRLVVCPTSGPGAGEVRIRVHAAGLNFRDVLTTMGMLATDREARQRIGFECTGEVTAVGAGVRNLRAGDQVLAMDLHGGAFGSFITVPASSVRHCPKGTDLTALAGVPVVFTTAWYALAHLAGLSAGERVLIHSAASGTGLAAIAVARLLGAEVLATAGNPEKRAYLRGMGIEQVMDSRSLGFRDETLAATGGDGVDVVLNSLSGPAVRAGLQTLRPFGRFIELGVRDIMADNPLGLAPLQHNITFSTVNLIELQQERPEAFARVLDEVVDRIGSGELRPLPTRTFDLGAAAEAFRTMGSAEHVGKLVLTVPQTGEGRACVANPSAVRPEGSYLITGGLRGVGLATARWLADAGAGSLVLNGRSAPSADAQEVLDELTARGVEVRVHLGDIAEPGVAERLVAAATENGRRLHGVVHSAMVLDDAVFANITHEQLEAVWRPKVLGAWQLHQALAGQRLDWLVLYSSMTSLLGNPGQGAYAAANAWLDDFARWRSAAGEPTVAVNWGPWGQIGQATDFAERGYQTISTEDGLRSLAELLLHRRTRTGVIPGPPPSWVPRAGAQSPFFSEVLAKVPEQKAAPDIRAELRSTQPGLARRLALERHIGEHVKTVLRLERSGIDARTPLRSLGFDSLLTVELRTRLETSLGVHLASNFIWQNTTLGDLAARLEEHLDLADAAT